MLWRKGLGNEEGFEDEGILKPFGDKRFQGEVLFHSSFITEQTKYVYFRGIMFSINFPLILLMDYFL